jgi:hypothetical protein
MSKIMEETFIRINSNKCFDLKLKPYSKEYLEDLVLYFEKKEEYEKCIVIINFINKRFNHDYNYLK